MFFTRLGIYAVYFAALYSFFFQPVLSLFSWYGGTYGASPAPPPGVEFPGLGNGTAVQAETGFSWYDLLFQLGVAAVNFVEMVGYKTVVLFHGLGSFIASTIPHAPAAAAVTAFFTGLGALLQVSMWWLLIHLARGGQL
jgi:hypothetical protein